MGPAQPQAFDLAFTSRGDRARVRVSLPTDSASRVPVVVLVPDAGTLGDAEAPTALASALNRAGVATAAIDLPLHGERADVKLSKGLHADLDRSAPGALVDEFVRQTLADLAGALAALAEQPEIDLDRSAIAGFGIGAALAQRFAGTEPRLRAIARIAPRDLAAAADAVPDAGIPVLDAAADATATLAGHLAGQLEASASGA